MSLFGAAIQTEKGSIHTHKQTRQIYIYRLISRRGSLRQNRLPGRTDKAAESYIQRRKEDDVRYGSKLEENLVIYNYILKIRKTLERFLKRVTVKAFWTGNKNGTFSRASIISRWTFERFWYFSNGVGWSWDILEMEWVDL